MRLVRTERSVECPVCEFWGAVLNVKSFGERKDFGPV